MELPLKVGVNAAYRGVAAIASEASPSPLLFIAKIMTVYVVPAVRLVSALLNFVMTMGELVVPLSVRDFHVVPLSVEYL